MLMGVPGSPPITDPRLRPKLTRSKGPFLRQHYPASMVVWPSPTPVRPAASATLGLPAPVETGLPRLRASPFQRAVPRTPADRGGCLCRLLPRSHGLPRFPGGSASASSLSRCYGADGGEMSPSSLEATPMERPMAQQLNDLSRSLTPLDQDSTILAVIEMSQASWLVAGIVPGIERHPLKKLEPSEVDLLRLLMRWRAEATQKGRTITRIAVAFEA